MNDRQIVLDTETTGLDPLAGHRVIEIGAVELRSRRRTGATFHRYLNPGREIDEGAVEVHGITTDFLADKPRFGDVAEELLAFVDGAELVIHNAEFDLAFLDAELERTGLPRRLRLDAAIADTLQIARRLHPGQKNTLDALCRRYGIDNAHRELHGALLDAEILAEVYLAMTGGQTGFTLDDAGADVPGTEVSAETLAAPVRRGVPLTVVRADAGELEAHRAFLERLDAACEGGAAWRAPGDRAPS